jgi:hypothetical protein
MTARSASVLRRTTPGSGILLGKARLALGRARLALGPNVLISDAVLAVALTAVALVAVARVSNPVSAEALAGIGTMSLAWRRLAPTAVLMISSASLFAEKLLQHPRTASSIAVLIALYTVAVTHRVLFTAVASTLLLTGAVVCDLTRHGWAITDFDDQFFTT